MSALLDVALEVDAAGICVVPPSEDGLKVPIGKGQRWKHFQTQRPTYDQFVLWYVDERRTGFGHLCGPISGNAEMLECERLAVYEAFKERGDQVGLGDVIERVEAGWSDLTPGGGVHLNYRCPEIGGNTKLARRPKQPDEMRDEHDKVAVLIETRGEGGFSVDAPSNGKVHPTGKPYVRHRGGPATMATITPEERRDLLALARTFDEMPRTGDDRQEAGQAAAIGERAGDDFNARATWRDVLDSHGWKHLFTRGKTDYWRRPGKDRGISASTNFDGSGLLYVFSTSTAFDAERGYSRFGAYAILNHDGDFKAAAKALAAKGYGAKRTQETESGGDAATEPQRAPDGRPAIDAKDEDLRRVSAQAWRALERANDPPQLFRFGGLPVRVATGDDGAPATQPLTEDRLRHELARDAQWFKTTERDGVKPALPPMAVVRDMLAAPHYPFPQLVGIAEVPTFAPDGSLPQRPGYHAASRIYYAPPPGFALPPVPADPTEAQIAAARQLLLDELLGDFPFAGDAERAHAVALLLLPFLRPLIDGPTPLHLIEKPTAGTGASLLAEVVARLATGRAAGAMTEGRDEDEWRKRITARLRGAPTVVLIDNLRRRLDSSVVSSVLTATYLEDRLLGTSDTLRLPVRCVWMATGNNPALSSELTRRTVRMRMDAKRDRPWLRQGFRHYPLLPWVAHERGNLIAACLTLGRAWIAAGRPVPADANVLGSFEDWSRVLAGVLDVAGVPGFLANLEQFYDASDTEGIAIRAFLCAWWDEFDAEAVGVSALFPVACRDDLGLDLGDKGERSQKTRLGRLLGDLRDRHYDVGSGVVVRVAAAGTERRAQLWRLIDCPSGERGERGEPFPPDPRARGEEIHTEDESKTFTRFTTFTDDAGDDRWTR